MGTLGFGGVQGKSSLFSTIIELWRTCLGWAGKTRNNMAIRFQQILGECDSKEWASKLSNEGESPLWAMIKLTNLNEHSEELEGCFLIELSLSSTDINWLDPEVQGSKHFELLVEQQFTDTRMQELGDNPLELLYECVSFAKSLATTPSRSTQ